MAEPNLSVVVLAWNQPETTQSCIASIRAHTAGAYELILVDNGSRPSLADALDDLGDRHVRNDDNLGFGPGMNTGLAQATAPYVAFLNNDTVVPAAWNETLIGTFEDYPNSGIVVPAVTAAGNPIAVRTAPGNQRIVVDPFMGLPSGVAYVMQTATIRALGGWDERYVPATAEDLDLLWSVWANGLDVVIDERVLIEHEGSATIKTDLPRSGQVLRTNRLQFTARWASEDPGAANIAHVDEATFLANLRLGRVAAHWMERAFRSEDSAAAARRTLEAETRRAAHDDGSALERLLKRFSR